MYRSPPTLQSRAALKFVVVMCQNEGKVQGLLNIFSLFTLNVKLSLRKPKHIKTDAVSFFFFFRDYAAIVFFANNRFETGKKKLQYITFQDFAFCAGQLINNWTVGAVGEEFSLFPLALSADLKNKHCIYHV